MTVPFAAWISSYSHAYLTRTSVCEDTIRSGSRSLGTGSWRKDVDQSFGRDKELLSMQQRLSGKPSEFIIVAGPNDVGKEYFLRELLHDRNYVKKLQLGTDTTATISGMVEQIVDVFGCQWLDYRSALVDVLPFAGGEILVMKERFSERDLQTSLQAVKGALTIIKGKRINKSRQEFMPTPGTAKKEDVPVIVLRYSGGRFHRNPEGRHALRLLLNWCESIRSAGLAHIVLTGDASLVFEVVDTHRDLKNHAHYVGLRRLEKTEAFGLMEHQLPGCPKAMSKRLFDVFGGSVRDLRSVLQEFVVSGGNVDDHDDVLERIIQRRLLERSSTLSDAFSDLVDAAEREREEERVSSDRENEEKEEEEEDDDPLSHLKSSYSLLSHDMEVREHGAAHEDEGSVQVAPLQLWRALQWLTTSKRKAVPVDELRDQVFGGRMAPILSMINAGIFSFELAPFVETTTNDVVMSSGSGMWHITPASGCLSKSFQDLTSSKRWRNKAVGWECVESVEDEMEEIKVRRSAARCKQKRLERQKSSLLESIHLGSALEWNVNGRASLQETVGATFSEVVRRERELYVEEYEMDQRMEMLEKELEEHALQKHLRVIEKLKMSVLARLRVLGGESTGIQDLRALFQEEVRRGNGRMDSSDGDGTEGSKEGSHELLRNHPMYAVFKEFDPDQSGYLTTSEFHAALANLSHVGVFVEERTTEFLVEAFDRDGDGTISYEEFLHMLLMDDASDLKGELSTRNEVKTCSVGLKKGSKERLQHE